MKRKKDVYIKVTREEAARWNTADGRRKSSVRARMEAIPKGHRIEVDDPDEYRQAQTAVKNLNKAFPKRKYGSVTELDKHFIFRLV